MIVITELQYAVNSEYYRAMSLCSYLLPRFIPVAALPFLMTGKLFWAHTYRTIHKHSCTVGITRSANVRIGSIHG